MARFLIVVTFIEGESAPVSTCCDEQLGRMTLTRWDRCPTYPHPVGRSAVVPPKVSHSGPDTRGTLTSIS